MFAPLSHRHVLLALLTLTVAARCGWAEQSVFTEARQSAAELKFYDGLPVVSVAGSPEEIGQQLGSLLKQPLHALMRKQDAFARGFGLGNSAQAVLRSGLARATRGMAPAFPVSQRQELAALAKTAGVDADLLALANVMYELSKIPACSTLGVAPARSVTGGSLLGRNLDFPTFGFLNHYSLVTVYRPSGKHAFASVTFPGFIGVASGMNDQGLCLAQLEVGQSAEKGPRFRAGGTPVAMCFRRLLEECATIDEAETLLRAQTRLIMCNLAIADRQGVAVLEITPQSVVRRPDERGISVCTNHFRSNRLAVNRACHRYEKLIGAQQQPQIGLPQIARLLDAANQGERTIQTMIFDPASLTLHLSLGPLPSSSQPLKKLDLKPLFAKTEPPPGHTPNGSHGEPALRLGLERAAPVE